MVLPTPLFRWRQIYLQPPRYCVGYSNLCKKLNNKLLQGGGFFGVAGGNWGRLGAPQQQPPPATSRAINPRQHRPKDLSKPRRDILPHRDQVLWGHQTSEPAERRKGTAQRPLQHSPRSPRCSPQSSFWVWAAPSTTPILWSLSRNRVSILKELRSLPPSSMCTLWTLLLTCPYQTCLFQYCYQLLPGAGFRPSLQHSWSPLIFPSFSRWRSFTILGTEVAPFLN